MNSMDKLQSPIDVWQRKTFPNGDHFAMMSHLAEEILELNDTIRNAKNPSEELADCQHLLFGIASRCGINLFTATVMKFEQNKSRKWGKPNKRGVVHHKKEAPRIGLKEGFEKRCGMGEPPTRPKPNIEPIGQYRCKDGI